MEIVIQTVVIVELCTEIVQNIYSVKNLTIIDRKLMFNSYDYSIKCRYMFLFYENCYTNINNLLRLPFLPRIHKF